MFVKSFAAIVAVGSAVGPSRNDMPGDAVPARELRALPHTYKSEESLPKVWDWRNVDGVGYVTPILNQHAPRYCGSCWLHAGIGVLNDRLKIARKGLGPDVTLARQVVLNCGAQLAGNCSGGSDYGVFVYAAQNGIPDDSCMGYTAIEHECSDINKCVNCDPPAVGAPCYPVQRYGKYYVTEYGKMKNPSVHQMKAEIHARGPISCAVAASWVEGDKTPQGGIITVAGVNFQTDHDIVIVGWGVDDVEGTYWIVKNSWGKFWGQDGFFHVKAGVNSMAIESECAWAVIEAEPRVEEYGPPDWDRVFRSTVKTTKKADKVPQPKFAAVLSKAAEDVVVTV